MLKRGNWSVEDLSRLKNQFGRKPLEQLARELKRTPETVFSRARQLYPQKTRPGKLSRSEENELRVMVGVADLQTMSLVLRRSQEEISRTLERWAYKERKGRFQPWEIRHLKQCYPCRPDWALVLVHSREIVVLRRKATELGLGRDKRCESVLLPGFEPIVELYPEAAVRMPRWTAAELRRLRKLYPSQSNLEIARELGRSVKSVVAKASEVGLKKTRRRLRQMGRENVAVRHDRRRTRK